MCPTGRIMLQYGGTFGAVGLAFTGVDCLAETIRGAQGFSCWGRRRCLHRLPCCMHIVHSSAGGQRCSPLVACFDAVYAGCCQTKAACNRICSPDGGSQVHNKDTLGSKSAAALKQQGCPDSRALCLQKRRTCGMACWEVPQPVLCWACALGACLWLLEQRLPWLPHQQWWTPLVRASLGATCLMMARHLTGCLSPTQSTCPRPPLRMKRRPLSNSQASLIVTAYFFKVPIKQVRAQV